MDKNILGDPVARYPHPHNMPVLASLGRRAGKPKSRARKTKLYIDEYELHTHPDLIERFEEICAGIPNECKSAVYGYPILVSQSGIIFGCARGTWVLTLRLAEAPTET